MKGSGLPYPPQAVLDEQMHQTKLAAILDPAESFDALRRVFFAPTMEVCGMQAFALNLVSTRSRDAVILESIKIF